MRILLLFLCSSVFFEGFTQSEVLLVGVTHAYPDRNPKRFEQVFEQVLEFKPEIIATEFLPPKYKNVAFNLGGKKLQKKVEDIALKSGVAASNRPRKIQEYLSSKEKTLHQQIKFCGLLYAQYDLANFYFQFYQLFKAISKEKVNLQSQWLLETEKYLFPKEENLTIANQLLGSEFGSLIFPLATELNMKRLYGVDNQDFYQDYQKVVFKSDKKLKKKLNLTDRELRDYLWGKYDTLDNKAMRDMKELQFLNSILHDSLVVNAFHKIKNSDDSKATFRRLQFWDYRNEKIAENLISLSNQFPQKRIVVFLGANHIPFIHQLLKEITNMKVRRLRLNN